MARMHAKKWAISSCRGGSSTPPRLSGGRGGGGRLRFQNRVLCTTRSAWRMEVGWLGGLAPWDSGCIEARQNFSHPLTQPIQTGPPRFVLPCELGRRRPQDLQVLVTAARPIVA